LGLSIRINGSKLTQARINKGLSLDEVATKLGVKHRSTISRWEREEMVPRKKHIEKLVEIMDTEDFLPEGVSVRRGK